MPVAVSVNSARQQGRSTSTGRRNWRPNRSAQWQLMSQQIGKSIWDAPGLVTSLRVPRKARIRWRLPAIMRLQVPHRRVVQCLLA